MISNISRIEKEFIFKFLIQNSIEIEIKSANHQTYAIIKEQNSHELKIEFINNPNSKAFTLNSSLEIFFYFQNSFHVFKTQILKIKNKIAILKNPEHLTRNLQRKFNRVKIDGKYDLEFIISGELIKLNYPETRLSYYPNKPPIDADFHEIKIPDLIAKFNKKISTLVSFNKIRMIRNFKPTTLEERITINNGKILYIPNTFLDFPQKQISNNLQILVKGNWFDYEKLISQTPAYLINNKLSNFLNDLTLHHIFSKAIIPILYKKYVIGLIYLMNDTKKNTPISINILEYTNKFSRLLSYALKLSGYFKEEEKNIKKYEVPVQDLSPGGLGFEHHDDFFEDKLLLIIFKSILISTIIL
jgi:hypothetical protein